LGHGLVAALPVSEVRLSIAVSLLFPNIIVSRWR
jgi:hypothetical protein